MQVVGDLHAVQIALITSALSDCGPVLIAATDQSNQESEGSLLEMRYEPGFLPPWSRDACKRLRAGAGTEPEASEGHRTGLRRLRL